MYQTHANAGTPTLLARRRSAFLRIHFWAALIASPFALIAACTGILYIFTPQIEAVLYHSLDQVTPATALRPLDDAVAAAQGAAAPGWRVHSVLPAYGALDSVKVNMMPPAQATTPDATEHEGHAAHAHAAAPMAKATSNPAPSFGLPKQSVVVFVNPYTAQVLGMQASTERFNAWAKKLHSSLLQGEKWRWMIELAASWLMVMLLTGIVLWWPNGTQKALPQAGSTGRLAWKQWHALIGVALSLMSLTMLATGLTWSKLAGDQVRTVRDAIGQAPPTVPRGLHSLVIDGAAPMNWQTAWDASRRHAPDVAMQLTPPAGTDGVWRGASADRSQPAKRFDLLLDAYNGKPLYFSGWGQQTTFAQATAIGIPFHRGEFGWWNQALLLVFGAGIVFSLLSGWVMFFKRRQVGAPNLPRVLPRLLPGAWKSVSPVAWCSAIALCALLPLLALSAGLVLLLELGLHRHARMRAA